MLALLAAQPTASSKAADDALVSGASPSSARGFAAYRAGDYHAAVPGAARRRRQGSAQQGLGAVRARRRASSTTATTARARDNFEKLAHGHGRPAQMAPFRIADCLWMEGDHAKAAASYARLAKTATARTGDVALARFRVAEQAAERDKEAAPPQQFLAIARDFPAHPLADEALRRIGAGHARAAADDAARPAHTADHAHRRAARRRSRSRRPAEARGVAVEGPPLG